MDVPKKRIVKWTRYQHTKAEEELLEKARILKEQKDSAKRNAQKNNPEKPTTKWSRDEAASSSDIEILDEEYIPHEQRSKIDLKLAPIPGYNLNHGTQKPIGAPSWFDSVSISSDGTFVDDIVYNGVVSDDSYCKKVENHNQGTEQAEEIGNDNDNDNLFSRRLENNDGENQNLETSDSSSTSEFTSEFSSEENGNESDDDYIEEESAYSSSESDDSRHRRKGKGGPDKDKDDHITKSRNRTMNHEMEDDDGNYRSILLKDTNLVNKEKSGNVHEKSRKRMKVLDFYAQADDDGTRKYDERRESSLQQQLPPHRASDYGKTRSCSGKKLSCEIRVSCNDAVELSDANEPSNANKSADSSTDSDQLVQKSRKRSRIATRKQFKRKNHELKAADFLNILADSISEIEDTLKDKLPPLDVKDQKKIAIPLKFRFTDDDPILVEKDEEQKEIENLFADLEMGWIEEDIGSTKLSKEDNNDDAAPAAKVIDPVESCRLGYHSLIFDETTGVICKCCGIVQLEMKHHLPGLKMRTKKRKEWFDFYKDESSLSFEFQFDEESPSGCNHHAFIDAEGPILNIIPPYLRRQMYPHQLDGFQFLWKKIAGVTSLEDLKTSFSDGGTGCIISHAPGTGKSFLTIVFLLTLMEIHPTSRPVIIAPVNMLHAWAMELKRWKVNIPFRNLQDSEFTGEENIMAASIIQPLGSSIRDRKQDKHYKRMVKLYSWTKGRSILGLGYKLFGKLAGDQKKGNHHGEKLRKILLELPGILILDEGHTARNENSMLWKTLTKIQTGRRVILSGTPFQNNHNELYNILCLVNPTFAESIPLKTGRFDPKRKTGSGKERWASLTSLIDNEDDNQAAEELRALIAPFVHVHKGNVLEERLPGLRDTLVVLNPSDLQKQLVHQILGKVPKKYQKENRNFFEKVHLVSLVSVHPSLVSQYEEFSDQKSILEEQEMSPELGVKTQFVIEIVRLSAARDEKVLVFSEFIDPLNFLQKQLTSYFSWEEGKQVLYMDGKLGDKQRQLVISSLNAHNSESKVLLASVKACSEGINLVGASRVVLLDVVWNPSFERQAICRAYRLGQKKIVYIYHLIMSGTKMEIDKYLKQAKKDRLSEQLFPSSEGGGGHIHEAKLSGDDDILDAMVHHKKLGHIFEKILPRPKLSHVFENFDFVYSAN